MKIIKNITFFLVLGIALNFLCTMLKNNYLINFLDADIILIFIPLLAINLTTSSFIIGKLSDLTEKYGSDFSHVYKELKIALFEQIALIAVATLCLILKNSCYFLSLGPNYLFAINSVLLGAFIYYLDILRDTGISIFQIFEALEEKRKKNQ